jgi:hypothetical protein
MTRRAWPRLVRLALDAIATSHDPWRDDDDDPRPAGDPACGRHGTPRQVDAVRGWVCPACDAAHTHWGARGLRRMWARVARAWRGVPPADR